MPSSSDSGPRALTHVEALREQGELYRMMQVRWEGCQWAGQLFGRCRCSGKFASKAPQLPASGRRLNLPASRHCPAAAHVWAPGQLCCCAGHAPAPAIQHALYHHCRTSSCSVLTLPPDPATARLQLSSPSHQRSCSQCASCRCAQLDNDSHRQSCWLPPRFLVACSAMACPSTWCTSSASWTRCATWSTWGRWIRQRRPSSCAARSPWRPWRAGSRTWRPRWTGCRRRGWTRSTPGGR